MSSISTAASTEQMKEMYRTAAKSSMGSDACINAAKRLHLHMSVASIDGRTFTKSSVGNVRLVATLVDKEHDNDITISDDGEDIQAAFE